MASEAPVDPAVIRKTQESLGRIITKPPLTDKLLRKPPFAFLHDIVTEASLLSMIGTSTKLLTPISIIF